MNAISRRRLLMGGAAGIALSVFAPAAAADAAIVRGQLYSRTRFKLLRHRKFTLSSGAGSMRVTLTKVRDLPCGRAGDHNAFTVTFRASKRGPDQGTFVLRRRGFAPTTLFVVPSDDTRRTYHAVVNRSR